MKLLKYLNSKNQVAEQYAELTETDFKKINDTLSRQGGVISYSKSGAHSIDTDGDETLVQTGRAKINEASALNNVTIADMEDKPNKPTNKGAKTADQLEVGDAVEITGDVQYKGETGEISKFGKDKQFVIVTLHKHGKHSFHSSDVTELDTAIDDDDETEDEEVKQFYVAFYDEDEESSWIGLISREGGGKWHEHPYKGNADYRWGQSYMSYLSPNDIMSWIHKDYHRGIEIEGPFFTAQEAEQFVKRNWGKLEEGATVNEAGPFSYGATKPRKGSLAAQIAASKKRAEKQSNAGSFDINDDKVGNASRVRDSAKKKTFNNFVQWKDAAAAEGLRVLNSSPVVAMSADMFTVCGKWDGSKGWISAAPRNVNEDMMTRLDKIAASHGTKFHLLNASIAAELVDFKKANALTLEHFGKQRFWSLKRSAMARIVNENPDIVIGLSESGKPSKPELEAYRLHVLHTLKELHNIMHHIAEEELISCKTHRIEPIGDILDPKKFNANSEIDVVFYTDCNDKPRKQGLQDDLTEKLQKRFVRHPFDGIGVINVFVVNEEKIAPVNEADETWADLEKWKAAVKHAYPDVAKKLVFKAKIESGISTISAEVPGQDRSYGVWDMDEKKGYVLGESTETGDL